MKLDHVVCYTDVGRHGKEIQTTHGENHGNHRCPLLHVDVGQDRGQVVVAGGDEDRPTTATVCV